jgi:hypothetical protein
MNRKKTGAVNANSSADAPRSSRHNAVTFTAASQWIERCRCRPQQQADS